MRFEHFGGETKEKAVAEAAEELDFPAEALDVKVCGERDDCNCGKSDGDGEVKICVAVKAKFVAEELMEEARDLLEKMQIEAEVGYEECGTFHLVCIKNDKPELLIGYMGETLDALQYLLLRMTDLGGAGMPMVLIDVDNYRRERIEDLGKVCDDLVKDVLKSKQEEFFDPMDSIDRKIVHMLLAGREGIRTYSKGYGRTRHVIVAPANESIGLVSVVCFSVFGEDINHG